MPNISGDAAQCRAMLRHGSRTFFAASWVLPSAVRAQATALYAFCRMADDAIDHGQDRSASLADLRTRLQLIYRGTPGNAATDRAFAETVARHAIPQAIPLALLEGFAWDAESRQYENLTQLTDYAVRVAGTVGLMMAMVMGVRDPLSLARACDLGVAMQLTNIARDVGEDARCGRLYLPLEWLRQAGIEPQAWLARPVFTAPLAGVIQRLLAISEYLYRRSEAGLSALPSACRPGMYAARLLYAEIGKEVARRKFDSVSQRAVVGWARKARILARAVTGSSIHRISSVDPSSMLPEAGFLIGPVVQGAYPEGASAVRRPRLEDRIVWLINLFERLERENHSRHSKGQQTPHPAGLEAIQI